MNKCNACGNVQEVAGTCESCGATIESVSDETAEDMAPVSKDSAEESAM